MEPYWLVKEADVMQNVAQGEPMSCTVLLSAMAAVVIALAGALVKVAKLAWEERMGRITDKNETITQLRVMSQAMKEREGGNHQ